MAKFDRSEQALKSLIPFVDALTNHMKSLNEQMNSAYSASKKQAKGQEDLKKSTSTLTTLDKELLKVEKQLAISEAKLTKEYQDSQKALLEKKAAINANTAAMKKDLDGTKKQTSFTQKMSKSFLAAGVAMMGLNSVMQIAKRVFADAFKTITQFEKSMSKVKAVANASDDEIESLTKSAKMLGSVTSKTASEVSGLQLEFAKLGFGTKQILAATEATISLSIAAGADLAESAVVAASTIRGFGLDASSTQRVVDVMAKSFSSSALDMEKFKTAMATVAPVAKTAGVSIERTTANLSVLANAGLDASTAGTSMRNIYLELAKSGLSWDEAMAKINNSTNKNAVAMDLFGKRGATAAILLATNSKEADNLTESYNNAAFAARDMARVMEDNLLGDTTKLKSAWEGLILTFQDADGAVNGMMRRFVKQLTDGIGLMANLRVAAKASFGKIGTLTKEELDQYLQYYTTTNEYVTKWAGFIRGVERATKEDLIKQLEAVQSKRSELSEKEFRSFLFLIDKRRQALKLEAEAEIEGNDMANKAKIIADLDAANERIEIARTSAEKIANERIEIARTSAEKIAKAEANLSNEITQQIIKQNESIISETEKTIDDSLNLIKEELTEVEKLTNESIDKNIKKREEDLKKAEDEKERKLKLVSDIAEYTSQLANGVFAIQNANRESEIQNIERQRDAEIAAAEKTGKDTSKIEAKYAKKEAKLREEQAKANKKQAVFNTLINSFPAIVRAFATGGVPLGLLMMTLTGLQIAAIAKEPIPAYKDGDKRGVLTDRFAKVSEIGQELKVYPDGSTELTPKNESIQFIPKGTKIFPSYSQETKEYIESGIDNGLLENIHGELQENTKAIRRLPSLGSRGDRDTIKSNEQTLILMNRRFK